MNTTSRFFRAPFATLAGFSLVFAAAVFSGCNGAHAAKPEVVEAAALSREIEDGAAPLVIDVRTPDEYAAGHVPGAINIPHDQMEARATEIIAHKDERVVLYCRSGRRSGIAAGVLADKGFTKLGLLEGDMPGWEKSGYAVER